MLDKTFLIDLNQKRNKTTYARITRLDLNEYPLDTIEGRITSGSINIDGASAVRRTCSLSMVTDRVDISDYLWGLNTKFKLEIGVENKLNENYPEIIWFNQGIFINVSFSTSLSTNNYTINLSGKDKMCQLNGENGGILPFEVDFGKYEEINEKGQRDYVYNTLHDIIREAVHHYGGEPFHNIIINDLENKSVELLEYKYDVPLYLFRQVILDENDNFSSGNFNYENGTLNADQKIYIKSDDNTWTETVISELERYDLLVDNLADDTGATREKNGIPFKFSDIDDQAWCAAKIEYGQTGGYRNTDFIYNGELIAKAGETITSVLDKIKSFLGNYEYFYDINGRFIFQEQKNYLNTAWSPVQENNSEEIFVDPLAERTMYDFKDTSLFTAFNNTPNLANVKNDYAIWGTRKGTGGAAIPIHMRYAIDEKPTYYKSIAVDDNDLIEYNKKYGFVLVGQASKEYTTIADYELVSKSTGINSGYKSLGVFFVQSGYDSYPTDNEFFQEGRRIFVNFNYEQNEKIPLKLNFSREEHFNDEWGYPIWSNGIETSATNPLLWKYGAKKEFVLKKDENNNWYWEANPAIDWREIIYQMALDYNKYNHLDDFALRVATANPNHYPLGRTGYEQYYVDMEGFWRELYNPTGAELFETVNSPTKDDIDKYYVKNDVYTKVTNLDEDNIPQVPTGTKLYKKVGNEYQRTYKGALGKIGDYYTLSTTYDLVIPEDNETGKYLLDEEQTGNIYEYDINEINEGRETYCIVGKGTKGTGKNNDEEQSATVTLSTSVNPIVISTQPQHTSFIKPDNNMAIPVRVYCNAIGEDLEYLWYYKHNNYRPSSRKNNIYSFEGSTAGDNLRGDSTRNNRELYCKITDKYHNTISTDSIIITEDPIYFTKQLKNEHFIYKKNGEYKNGFEVGVGKTNNTHELRYEWYEKKTGEFKFNKSSVYGTGGSSNCEPYQYGVNTTWNNSHNGYQIYCKVINTTTKQSIISKTITLTQSLSQEANSTTNPYTIYAGMSLNSTLPAITFVAKDAKNKDVPNGQLIGGEKIDLTISNYPTSNSDIHYYWYVKKKDETNFSLVVDLVNTATYSIGSIDSSYDGAKFYCVIEDAWKRCYVVDNDLTISFWPEFKITEQPKDASYEVPGPFLYSMPWAERNLLKFSQPPKGMVKNNTYLNSYWGASSTIYEPTSSTDAKPVEYGAPMYHEGTSSKKPYIRLKTRKGKNQLEMAQPVNIKKGITYILTADVLWQSDDSETCQIKFFGAFANFKDNKATAISEIKTSKLIEKNKSTRVSLELKIKDEETPMTGNALRIYLGCQPFDTTGKRARFSAEDGKNSLYLSNICLEPGVCLFDYKEGYTKGFYITPGNCKDKNLIYYWYEKKPNADSYKSSSVYGTFGSVENVAPNYYGTNTSFSDRLADYHFVNKQNDTGVNNNERYYTLRFNNIVMSTNDIPSYDNFFINGRKIFVTFEIAQSQSEKIPLRLNFTEAEGFKEGWGYYIYKDGKQTSKDNPLSWEAGTTKEFTFFVSGETKYWKVSNDNVDLSKNYDEREYKCKVYDGYTCAISNKVTLREAEDKSKYQCWNSFIQNKPETGLPASELFKDGKKIGIKFTESNETLGSYPMSLNFPSAEGYKDTYGYYICKNDGSNHTNGTFTWKANNIKYFEFKIIKVNGVDKKCWVPCSEPTKTLLFTTPAIKLRKQYTGGTVNNSYHKLNYIKETIDDDKTIDLYTEPSLTTTCTVKTSFDDADYNLLCNIVKDDSNTMTRYDIYFNNTIASNLIPRENKFFVNGKKIFITFNQKHLKANTKSVYLNFVAAEGFNDGSGFPIYKNGEEISRTNPIEWNEKQTLSFTFIVDGATKYWRVDNENIIFPQYLEYQWYYKGINDTAYSKSTVQNQTKTFNLSNEKIQNFPNQILVYCAIKDKKSGKIVNTNHALLSVKNTPSISFKAIGINETTKKEVEQDLVDNTMIWGLGKEFTIKAILPTGYKANTVKWFQKNSDEPRFSEISQYKGTLKYGYDASAETGKQYLLMSENISGRKIYCTVENDDGNKIQSDIITIRLPKKLTAPKLDNRIKGASNWNKFTVLKNNVYAGECETTTGLQYQWYEIKDDGSESKIDGATSSTYKAEDYIKVFCEITDKYGQKARTNTATVRACILDDPISQMSPGGKRATLEVWADKDAKSDENRYQWYYNPFDYSTQYYIPTTKFDYGLPWVKQIVESPETLNFWIDFLDTDGDLSKFSVKAIGSRPKVVNDKDVKAIYYRDIPDVYYSDDEGADDNQHGKLQIPMQYASMFSRSTQGKSAKEAIDTQLYNHAHCIESVSITTIPIYYLEPNKRIYVNDPESGISGDYIVTKITIPLAYNGTMNLTATKAVDRIL